MVKITSQTAAMRAPKGTHSTSCKGLQLRVQNPGVSASWVCRYTFQGRQRDRGLGEIQLKGFVEACDEVNSIRKLARQGIDAFAKKAVVTVPTFAAFAAQVHEKLKPTFKNSKHAAQWATTLTTYANPIIGHLPVDQVDQAAILRVMNQEVTNSRSKVTGNFWVTSNETANRTLQRIAKVLDVATAEGHRSGDNPATVIRRANVLPKVRKASDAHHAALPWRDLPAFWAELSERTDNSGDALRLLILTAARTSEVLGMTWDEIDFDNCVWTVPAERMKAGKLHDVPLSSQAVKLLRDRAVKTGSVGLVFKGQKGKSLSNMAMLALLKRMGRTDITAHGMRSTFRDWCSDNGVDRVVAEAALAHSVQSKVEAAYARSTMLERRKPVMQAWADHAAGAATTTVSKLHGALA